jgi:hypothetical protein
MVWPDTIWHIAQTKRHNLEICANRSTISASLAVFERHVLALCPFSKIVSDQCPFRDAISATMTYFHYSFWRNVQATASF